MKKTRLYPVHEKLGAKIVEFAGYLMPIQYSSIIAEHNAVRDSVGVFDVSHMGEIFVTGEKAKDFVQYITVNDVSKLYPGRVQYSAMCYNDAGIVDDLLVYNFADDKFLLVVNASNIEKDFSWMNENNKFGVTLENKSDEYSLIAVQGPNSNKTLQKICDKEINLEYYHFFEAKVAGIEMILSRTGYTGELGYELYFKGDEKTAEHIWNNIFEAGLEFNVKPVGLAARDSLRLEMGFMLYGNDIDKTTNPLEAGLGWITKLNKGNFIGRDVLLKVKSEGLSRKFVAMLGNDKSFPRHGYEIKADNKKIGEVTSGTVSPVLEKPIAMGYVDVSQAAEGNEVNIVVRGRETLVKIVKLPFIKK
jgi:aminomethyltransferase